MMDLLPRADDGVQDYASSFKGMEMRSPYTSLPPLSRTITTADSMSGDDLGLRAGTTVVAIRVPGPAGTYEVYIAADSLTASLQNGVWVPHSTSVKICRVAHNVYCVAARVFKDTATSFDAYSIVHDVYKADAGLISAFKKLPSVLEPRLRTMLLSMKTWARESFDYVCADKPVLEILIAGSEGGKPKLFLLYFMAKIEKDSDTLILTPEMRALDGSSESLENGYTALGEHDHVDAILRDPQFFSKQSLLESLNILVGAECDAHPENIGRPISILKLDGTSRQWLQNGPNAE